MSTLLASQATLNNLSNKLDGKSPVRINFLDNSSKLFLVSSLTTVKEVLEMCLEKYNIIDLASNLPYYGLFESRNGGSVDGSLPLESTVGDVLHSWADLGVDATAKWLFMIRLYMPSITGLEYRDTVAHRLNETKANLSIEKYLEHAATVDENALHLQFIQAVYNVITGRYPTTVDEALDLGAIHFLFKFNEFKAASHKVGFLNNRIVEFIPIKHLKSGSSGSIEEWETRLFERVHLLAEDSLPASASTKNNDTPTINYFHRDGVAITPQRTYMNKIFGMKNLFGNSFYRCTQRSARVLPESPYIAIHHQGITIFDKNKKLVRSFHIEEIYRWGFKPNTMFYFEVSVEDNADLGTGSLEFDTTEGKTISDQLTDYAMAFLKERELEDERVERRAKLPPVPPVNGKSPTLTNGAVQNGTPKLPSSPVPPVPATSAPTRRPSSRVTSTPTKGKTAATTKAENKAATKLQALFRGFTLRNEWSREDAAILIQSVFRGYRARIALSDMIEQMIKAGEL